MHPIWLIAMVLYYLGVPIVVLAILAALIVG